MVATQVGQAFCEYTASDIVLISKNKVSYTPVCLLRTLLKSAEVTIEHRLKRSLLKKRVFFI